MKKFFALAITALFVLGIAATAFAIHAEIPAETSPTVAKGTTMVTVGGYLRSRGETRQNASDFDDKNGDHLNFYDQKIRINMDAKVSDKTKAYIEYENSYTWGTNASTATGGYPVGNQSTDNTNALQGWVDHNVVGAVHVKIGHMPLGLGRYIFFDHTLLGDDAIIVYADPAEGVHVAGLTAKFGEAVANNADSDGYVLLGVYSGGMFNVSGDLTWVKERSAATRTVFMDGFDFYNLGVRGDVNVGPANIYADIEYQTGTADGLVAGDDFLGLCANNSIDPNNRSSCDFTGRAILVGASFKLAPVNLGVELAQGTGDEDAFQKTGLEPIDSDIEMFITSRSGSSSRFLPTFIYDARIIGAMGATNMGLANTTYLKVSADASLTDALSLSGAIVKLQATEEVQLGCVYANCATKNNGTELALDDDLGLEIDAKATYKLGKNLKYWIEGGYFMPGDAYARQDTSPGATVDATKDADDVYALRHGIELSF